MASGDSDEFAMQYTAIQAYFFSEKKIVILFRNTNTFSRSANKDLSAIGKKFAFTRLVA